MKIFLGLSAVLAILVLAGCSTGGSNNFERKLDDFSYSIKHFNRSLMHLVYN
ncbi:MAG: hypothetical protein Q7K65_01470 [Candidatus Buchananbacteria bacterium]|nr:hypothetical protein [Candidatus Buchananbacteria bacterium]